MTILKRSSNPFLHIIVKIVSSCGQEKGWLYPGLQARRSSATSPELARLVQPWCLEPRLLAATGPGGGDWPYCGAFRGTCPPGRGRGCGLPFNGQNGCGTTAWEAMLLPWELAPRHRRFHHQMRGGLTVCVYVCVCDGGEGEVRGYGDGVGEQIIQF